MCLNKLMSQTFHGSMCLYMLILIHTPHKSEDKLHGALTSYCAAKMRGACLGHKAGGVPCRVGVPGQRAIVELWDRRRCSPPVAADRWENPCAGPRDVREPRAKVARRQWPERHY